MRIMFAFMPLLALTACTTQPESAATVSVWGLPAATVQKAVTQNCPKGCPGLTITQQGDTLFIKGEGARGKAQAIAAGLAP